MNECAGELMDWDSAEEDVGHPAENGLIVRNIAAAPADWTPHHRPQAKRLSFSDLLDVRADVLHLAPGACTEMHRHTYEAVFYVIAGSGHTSISVDDREPECLEWRAGDLFITPRRVWHQLVNDSRSTPARLVEVTTAPLMEAWGTHSIEHCRPELNERHRQSDPVGDGKRLFAVS